MSSRFDSRDALRRAASVVVESLECRRLMAFQAGINFQPYGSEAATGYYPDNGDVYGLQQNGLTYGWDATLPASATFDRNDAGSLDARYDTGIDTAGAGRKWELALPNGTYRVRVVAGDAGVSSGSYNYNVEGTAGFLSGVAGSGANRWITAVGNVIVTDGKLTITNGTGANTRLAFVDVTEATAAASNTAPGAPSNLIATPRYSTSINLRWDDNADNEMFDGGYRIERKTGSGAWSEVGQVQGDSRLFVNFANVSGNTTYTFRVRAAKLNSSGQLIYSAFSNEFGVTTPANDAQGPYYGAAWQLTDPIEVEDFDRGLNNQAYYDLGTSNAGGFYRSGNVDIGLINSENLYYVGWTEAGEWQEYTTSVPATGNYYVETRVSAGGTQGGGTFKVGFTAPGVNPPAGSAGTYQTANIQVPNTNGFTNYTTVRSGVFAIAAAGTQVMRMYSTGEDPTGKFVGNFDWVKVQRFDAPSGLAATTISAGQINLAWTSNASNPGGFVIERKTGTGGTWANAGTVGGSVTTFQDTNLTAGTQYFYRVKAVAATLTTAFSGEANATTFVAATTPPAAPSNLSATLSGTQVALAWTDNAGNETGFVVQRSTGGGAWATIATPAANTTTYTDTVSSGNNYAYRVAATNTAGASSYSNTAALGQITSVSVIPAADLYVHSGTNAPTNFGSATELLTKGGTNGYERQAYFRFDLAAFTGNASNIKLRLYGGLTSNEANNLTFAVKPVTNTTWSESATTWNNKPTITNTALGTQTVTDATDRWYEFDVTAYVLQERAAGKTAVSFAVVGTASTAPAFSIWSKEQATNKPHLLANVASTTPQATFANGGPVNEGSTGSVSFTNPSGGTAPYTYSYDFNDDGTFDLVDVSATVVVVPASYLADGPAARVVRGRIKDATGATADYTTSIAVQNVTPQVSIGGLAPSYQQGDLISSAAVVSDPGNDLFTYAWSVLSGGNVIKSGSGANWSTQIDTAGEYVFSVTVTDDDGAATTVGAAVTIHAPVVAPVTSLSADASWDRVQLTWQTVSSPGRLFLVQRSIGTGLWATVGAVGAELRAYADVGLTPNTNYTYRVVAVGQSGATTTSATNTVTTDDKPNVGPEARDLSYRTHAGTPLLVTDESVVAQNGDPEDDGLTVGLVATTQHGTLDLEADGTFVYTPSPTFVGTDTFTYTLSDGVSVSTAATVRIVVADTVPVARPAWFDAGPDRAITITNPAEGLARFATDEDGDDLTFELVNGPGSGSLQLNPDGTFQYVAAQDSPTWVTFRYRVVDARGASTSAEVRIAVASGALRANDEHYATPAQTPLIVDAVNGVLANEAPPAGQTISAKMYGSAEHGTVTLNADGSFIYTPHAGYAGPDRFRYYIGNNASPQWLATTELFVYSRPPVAWTDAYQATSGRMLRVAAASGVTVNDQNRDAQETLSTTLVRGTAHGSLVLHSDGSFDYRPAPDFVGVDAFIYRLSDGTSFTSEATVSIRVTDGKPLTQSDAYRLDVAGQIVFPTSVGVLANDDPADGFARTAVLANGPTHGVVQLNADGSFAYDPSDSFAGVDSFTYRLLVDGVYSDPTSVTLRVENATPDAVADRYDASPGRPLTVNAPNGVLSNDADVNTGTTLTAALLSQPLHGAVSLNANGSFTYYPGAGFSGQDSFVYVAHDGVAESAPTLVRLNVTGRLPVTTDDSYTVTQGLPLSVPAATGVLSNDVDADGDTLAAVLLQAPVSGQITLNADGSFTYTAEVGFTGPVSFVYQASDGHNASVGIVRLDVAAVNYAPTAQDHSFTVPHDRAYTSGGQGVLAGALDSNGDTLRAVLVTTPAHGTLALRGNGTFVYVPAAGYTGADTFTFRATDGAGQSAIKIVSLDVRNAAPVSASGTYAVRTNQMYRASALGGLKGLVTDTDADRVTIELVYSPANGTLTLAADGSFVYTPNAGFSGTDQFSYRASDGIAASSTATIQLVVSQRVAATHADRYTMLHDRTLSVHNGHGVLHNDWGYSGETLTASIATGPSNGVVTLATGGGFSYVPNPGFVGTDTFTYAVASDGETIIPAVPVTITVTNQNPVAQGESFSVRAGESLSIGALSGLVINDSDPDGPDSVTALLIGGPSHGTVALQPSGAFLYTPASGYAGGDSFTYRVTDGVVFSEVVRVSISVGNAVPEAGKLRYRVRWDKSVSGSILPASYDPDGDPLGITLATQPAHGTVTLAADGSFTYTPDGSYVGPDSFGFRLDDGLGGVRNGSVNLDVWNDAPQPNSDRYVMANKSGKPLSGNVLLNDAEPSGHPLTAVGPSGQAYGQEFVLTAHGRFTLQSSGVFVYIPNSDFVGTDQFEYRANDGVSLSDRVAVVITVTNAAPVVAPDFFAIRYGETLSGSLAGNDSDPDATGTLTYTKVGQNNTSAGEIVISPNGAVAFVPAENQRFVGTIEFSYNVTDGVTKMPGQAVLEIRNTPPRAIDDIKYVRAGQAAAVDVSLNDLLPPAAAGGVYTLTGSVTAGATLTNTGRFNFNPDGGTKPGDYEFTYEVTDAAGQSDTATILVGVLPPLLNVTPDHFVTPTRIIHDNVLNNDKLPDGSPAGGGSGVIVTSVNGKPFTGSISQPIRTKNGRILEFSDNGWFRWQADPGFLGIDTLNYTAAKDGSGGYAEVTLERNGSAPVAVNKSYTTGPDGVILIPESDLLTSFGLGATLNFPRTPRHGSLGKQGEFYRYQAQAGYVGDDSILYKLVNEDGISSSTKTITITVARSAGPRTGAGDYAETNEDEPVDIFAFANDSHGPAGYVNHTQPEHGTVMRVGDKFVYTPDTNWFATGFNADHFVYRVGEAGGTLVDVPVTISVSPVPDAPQAYDDSVTLAENTTAYVQVAVNDINPDVPGSIFSPTALTIEQHPSNGKLIWGPGGLSYTPNPGFHGTDSARYTVFNQGMESDSATVTFTVTPVNEPPVRLREPKTPRIPKANGASASLGLLDNVFDVDGDNVSIKSVSLPTGQGFTAVRSGNSVVVTVTDAASAPSSVSVYYVVTDGVNDVSFSRSVTIGVTQYSPSTTNTATLIGSSSHQRDAGWMNNTQHLSVSRLDGGSTPVEITFSAGQVTVVTSDPGAMLSISGVSDTEEFRLKVVWGNTVATQSLSVSAPLIDAIDFKGELTALIGKDLDRTIKAGRISAWLLGGITVYGKITADASITATGDILQVNSGDAIHGTIKAGGKIESIRIGRGVSSYMPYKDFFNGHLTGTVTAGGNIDYVDIGGDLRSVIRAGGMVGSIRIDRNLDTAGRIEAASGPINGVSLAGDMAGIISANNGAIGGITVGGDLSGTIKATGATGEVQYVSVKGVLRGTISSSMSIGTVLADYGIVDGSITAQTTLGRVYAVAGDITGHIHSGGTLGYHAGGWHGVIAEGGSVKATITSDASIMYVRAGTDVGGLIEANNDIYEIIAGVDLNAHVVAHGGVNHIYAGRNASGSVTAQDDIASMNAGVVWQADLTASGTIINVEARFVGGTFRAGQDVQRVALTSRVTRPAAAGLVAALKVEALEGSIFEIASSHDLSGNFTAAKDIGLFTSNSVYGGISAAGSITGAITATGGRVASVKAGKTLTAAVTAKRVVQTVIAGGDLTGAVTGGSIGSVSAVGALVGAVTAETGGIDLVTTQASANGAITAKTFITAVHVGKDLHGDVTAKTGSIALIEVGERGGGELSGKVKAGIDIEKIFVHATRALDTGLVPERPAGVENDEILRLIKAKAGFGSVTGFTQQMLPNRDSVQLGHLSGDVTAGGRVVSVIAEGILSGDIDAWSGIDSAWAARSISGDLVSGHGSIKAYTWDDLTGKVKGFSSTTVRAYDDVAGAIESQFGDVDAAAGDTLTSEVAAPHGLADLFAGTLLKPNVTIANSINLVGFDRVSGSATANSFTVLGTNSVEDLALTVGLVTAAPVFLMMAGDINGLIFKSPPGIQTAELEGYALLYSHKDAKGLNFDGGADHVSVIASGDVQGSFQAKESISIAARGDINATVTKKANSPHALGVAVEGRAISGTYAADHVNIDAAGNFDGAITAEKSADVHATGSVVGSIIVDSGPADVYSAGNITGTVKAKTLANVTTWGTLASGAVVEATDGIAIVEAHGDIAGIVKGKYQVAVRTWGDVRSAITSAEGSVSVFAAKSVKAEVKGGKTVVVQAGLDVEQSVEAGTLTPTGTTAYDAHVTANRNVLGEVKAQGSVYVSAGKELRAGVDAKKGDAQVEAGDAITATSIKASRDVSVVAGSIASGSSYIAAAGRADVIVHAGVSGLNVKAATAISIETGGTLDATAGLTSSQGNVSVSAVGAISNLKVNAAGARVDVFSGGAAQVAIDGAAPGAGAGSALPAGEVSVSAKGSLSGTVVAGITLDAYTAGSISDFTASTATAGGSLDLFADGSINATATAAGSMSVTALGNTGGGLMGTYKSGHGAPSPVYLMSVTVKNGIDATINAGGGVSVAAGETIAGIITGKSSVEVSGYKGVSAAITVTNGGGATVAAAGVGAAVSGAITADGDVQVYADGNVSGTITAGAADVTTKGSVSGNVTTRKTSDTPPLLVNDLTVTALQNVSGALSSVGAVDVTTAALSGTVTGHYRVTVFSRATISSGATIESTAGDVDVTTGGGVMSNLTGGSVSVSAGQAVNGNINARQDVYVQAGAGMNSQIVAAHDVKLVTQANAGGTITAGNDVSIDASGAVTATVNATGRASLVVVEDFTGAITARGVDLSTLGSVDGNIDAGSDGLTITAVGTLDGTLASDGGTFITAFEDMSANLSGDGSAEIEVSGDLTGNIDLKYGVSVGADTVSGDLASREGDLRVSAGIVDDVSLTAGGALDVTAYDTLTADIQSGGVTTLVAFGAIDVSLDTQGATAITGGSDVTMAGSVDGDLHVVAAAMLSGAAGVTGDATLTAHDALTLTSLEAGGDIDIAALGLTQITHLDAGGWISVVAAHGFSAGSVVSGGGAEIAADGGVTVLNLEAGGPTSVCATGSVSGTYDVAGTLEVFGNGVGGIWSSDGHLTVTSLGGISGAYHSDANIELAALGDVSAIASADGNLSATVYGALDDSAVLTADFDVQSVVVRGDLAGTITAGRHVLQIVTFGDFAADVLAGGTVAGGSSGPTGITRGVFVWGDLAGNISGQTVGNLHAGGALTAAVSGGTPASLHPNDPSVFLRAYPQTPDLNVKALKAAIAGALRDAAALVGQLATSKAALGRALAAGSAEQRQALAVLRDVFEQRGHEAAVSFEQFDKALTAGATHAAEVATALLKEVAGQASLAAESMKTGSSAHADRYAFTLEGLTRDLAAADAAFKQRAEARASEYRHAVEQKGLEKQAVLAAIAGDEANAGPRAAAWDRAALARYEALKATLEERRDGQSWADTVQNVLAVIGFFDPTGLVDVVNGTVSLVRGNYLEAAIYFVSALPGGDVAKLGKAFKSIAPAMCVTKRLALGVIGSAQMYQAYQEGDWLGMLFAVPMLLGAGRGQCFVAGTRVATGTNQDGSLSFASIEDVQVGDVVLTRGDLDGTLVERRVTARWAETTDHVRTLEVKLADGSVETIGTTDGHPFAVAGDGWREAGSLAVGSQLVLSDGRTGTLVESTRTDLPAGVTVYNLEVEGGHSYFVADGQGDDTQGVWVHNAKKYVPVRDSMAPKYRKGWAGSLVGDHRLSRAIGRILKVDADVARNIVVKAYATNARKGGIEGSFIKSYKYYTREGKLTPANALKVLRPELKALVRDAFPLLRPPSFFDKLPG